MNHFGKKVPYKKWIFDSIKERDFFIRFIENSGKRFKVHPSYKIVDKFPVGGYNQRGITYAPDFVVYGPDGAVEHVYDVKSGINQRAIDTAAKLRFKLFSLKTGVPVEVVVPRKHDFKMKLPGYGKADIQPAHKQHDKHGNLKTHKNSKGEVVPTYAYYNVYKNINYDIHDLIGE